MLEEWQVRQAREELKDKLNTAPNIAQRAAYAGGIAALDIVLEQES